MAVGAYALTTLVNLKSYLSVTSSADDTLMEQCIDRATARMERYMGRNIMNRAYTQWYSGSGARSVRLREYPVNSVQGVYTGATVALTVSSTVTTDIRATVSINAEAIGTGAAGMSLSRQTLTGALTATTLAFSTYDDVTRLAVAINLLTGFSATVGLNMQTAQMHPIVGDCLSSAVVLTGADVGVEYRYDSLEGILHVQSEPYWSGSHTHYADARRPSLVVMYTAGYATVPDDIEEACLEVSKYLFQTRKTNANLNSESLGDYSYTLADATKLSSMMADLLGYMREIR